MKYNYVYEITYKIDGRKYIGVRSTFNPNLIEDLRNYKSSSSDKTFRKLQNINPDLFDYKILDTFETRIEANDYERFLLKFYNVSKNTMFINKSSNTTYEKNKYNVKKKSLLRSLITKEWIENETKSKTINKIATELEVSYDLIKDIIISFGIKHKKGKYPDLITKQELKRRLETETIYDISKSLNVDFSVIKRLVVKYKIDYKSYSNRNQDIWNRKISNDYILKKYHYSKKDIESICNEIGLKIDSFKKRLRKLGYQPIKHGRDGWSRKAPEDAVTI